MGQDARKQPRTGHDDEAQLLKKREGVQLEPVLRDSAVYETVELEAGELFSGTTVARANFT